MLVHELHDLRREVMAERAPVGARRAVADGGGDGGRAGDTAGADHRNGGDHGDESKDAAELRVRVHIPPRVEPVRAADRIQKIRHRSRPRAGMQCPGTGRVSPR